MPPRKIAFSKDERGGKAEMGAQQRAASTPCAPLFGHLRVVLAYYYRPRTDVLACPAVSPEGQFRIQIGPMIKAAALTVTKRIERTEDMIFLSN